MMTTAERITRARADYDDVYEAGKRAECDSFWDEFQGNGDNAFPAQFAGKGWTKETFKPKYDIRVTNGYFLFYQNAARVDLPEWLDGLGIKLDTSELVSAQYLFWMAEFTHIGEIDFRKLQTSAGHTSQTFTCSYLVTIDKIILRDDGTNTFAANMFQNATKLENITFEGVIGYSIDFRYSPLSRESITNIIEHLSSAATGQTCTFKKSAKETAFTNDEWETLVSSKPNWQIELVT